MIFNLILKKLGMNKEIRKNILDQQISRLPIFSITTSVTNFLWKNRYLLNWLPSYPYEFDLFVL